MEKLKYYLDKRGIKSKFFAKKIGISQELFSYYMQGRPIPIRLWEKIVTATNKHVTIQDLMDNNIVIEEERLKLKSQKVKGKVEI
jgi:hypothetical protein